MSNKYAFYLLLTVIVVVVIVVVLKHLFKLLPFHRYENLLITFKDKAYFFFSAHLHTDLSFFSCVHFFFPYVSFTSIQCFYCLKLTFLFCLLLRYVFVLMKTTNFIFFIYLFVNNFILVFFTLHFCSEIILVEIFFLIIFV